jgi:heme exporter protein A
MWQQASLTAENLSCERGGRVVFSGINFTLNSGEALELRGANGSGKSSLLRLVARLNHITQGKLTFSEDENFAHLTHYIGHADAAKPGLTVMENISFWQKFYDAPAVNVLGAFRLEKLAEDQARLLSSGQKRRLALTRLVAIQRPLWLLDEPSVGLDHTALTDLTREMKTHLTKGGMIIAATHHNLDLEFTHHLNLIESP